MSGFDVAAFVENFEVLAGAVAGVEKLRGLVLHLAVRGRLLRETPLSPSDTPTSDGLSVPFGLPRGWAWSRVDEAGELKLGRQRSPKNHAGPNMRPYLRVANVQEARIDTSDVLEMNFEPDEAERFLLRPNDVLLNEGQSYELVGRPAIYRGEIKGACFQNTLIRFRPGKAVLAEFALAVFRAYMRTGRFRREAQQTTNIAHLSLGRLAEMEFPLPPLAEQHRIVAKVDQLMALCDDLEARQTKKREVGARLTKSALEALTTAEGPEEFDVAWKRVVESFDVVVDRAEKVGELRAVVLNLGVQGRLLQAVEQDGAGHALLGALKSYRSRLASEKRVRGFAVPPVARDEEPSRLPAAWAWARFGDLGDWGAGATPNRSRSDYYGGTMPWFKSGELNDGTIDRAEEMVSARALAECSLRVNEPGDVLVAMYGATIGKTAVLGVRATTNQAVCACSCFPGVDNRYLLLLLRAYKSRFVSEGAGGAQPNISKEKIVAMPAPLPPTSEQHRIVAKVDQLMALCDDLEAKLRHAEDRAAKLVEAAVQELLG